MAGKTSCPGCSIGYDDDGDAEQVKREQEKRLQHLGTLAQAVQGCHCPSCVRHLIHDVLEYAAQVPLVVEPTYKSERGSAAHLRDTIRAAAKGWR